MDGVAVELRDHPLAEQLDALQGLVVAQVGGEPEGHLADARALVGPQLFARLLRRTAEQASPVYGRVDHGPVHADGWLRPDRCPLRFGEGVVVEADERVQVAPVGPGGY